MSLWHAAHAAELRCRCGGSGYWPSFGEVQWWRFKGTEEYTKVVSVSAAAVSARVHAKGDTHQS